MLCKLLLFYMNELYFMPLNTETIIGKFSKIFIYLLQLTIKIFFILFYILFHKAFQNYTSFIVKW